MKVLCNITWRCSLGDCKYCWISGVDGVGSGFVDKQRDELSPGQWVKGLNRIPPGSTIDFCGGEPTLLGDGLVYVIGGLAPQRYRWGLTTNLAHDSNVMVVEELAKVGLLSCVSLNCSYHHGVEFSGWLTRFESVMEVFGNKVRINVIVSPFHDYSEEVAALRQAGHWVNYEPYQNPKASNEHSPNLWKCAAGLDHMVISPNGEVYSCLCAFRSERREEYRIGHLMGEIKYKPPYELCDLNCDPVEAKCWGIVRASKRRETE